MLASRVGGDPTSACTSTGEDATFDQHTSMCLTLVPFLLELFFGQAKKSGIGFVIKGDLKTNISYPGTWSPFPESYVIPAMLTYAWYKKGAWKRKRIIG